MLIELLSQSNYQSYNVRLAHLLGLTNAIHLGMLIEINEKAIRKNKLYDEKYFSVDREYITCRTTLTQSEQESIEDNLSQMGIIERTSDNLCYVNLNVIVELISSKDETLQADLGKIKQMANKSTKNEYILRSVKKNIKEVYPDELKEAYCEWLDVINSKFHFVSKQMLEMAESVVDEYSNRNLDIAISVIKIAQANGWKDMQYAVKRHRETCKTITAHKNDNVDIIPCMEF